MGYAAAPHVAFIVYGIQTFFTAIIIIIIYLSLKLTKLIYYYMNSHQIKADEMYDD